MPKKFKGENSKAAEARARKEATRSAEQDRKQKEAEDAYWADDDKHVGRKQQRKVGSLQFQNKNFILPDIRWCKLSKFGRLMQNLRDVSMFFIKNF